MTPTITILDASKLPALFAGLYRATMAARAETLPEAVSALAAGAECRTAAGAEIAVPAAVAVGVVYAAILGTSSGKTNKRNGGSGTRHGMQIPRMGRPCFRLLDATRKPIRGCWSGCNV